MKRVLILGVDGNLGRQVYKSFAGFSGISAIPYSREDFDFLEHDLILPKISEVKPDIIINTVAYNAVDEIEEFEDDFKNAKSVNGEAIKFLGQAAIKNNSVLVHYSSDYVFGGNNNLNYDNQDDDSWLLKFKEKGGFAEDDTAHPINKFGLSKLMGEEELKRLESKKLKYYLIRTSKLFGLKGKSSESKDNFFDLMLKVSKNKSEIDVVNEELSCFTYTVDLAQQTFDILNNKNDFGIYHVRNNGPAIWHDAAKEVFKIRDINLKINPVRSDEFPRPAKRPKYSVLANTKLPELRSWKEALREYLKNNNQ